MDPVSRALELQRREAERRRMFLARTAENKRAELQRQQELEQRQKLKQFSQQLTQQQKAREEAAKRAMKEKKHKKVVERAEDTTEVKRRELLQKQRAAEEHRKLQEQIRQHEEELKRQQDEFKEQERQRKLERAMEEEERRREELLARQREMDERARRQQQQVKSQQMQHAYQLHLREQDIRRKVERMEKEKALERERVERELKQKADRIDAMKAKQERMMKAMQAARLRMSLEEDSTRESMARMSAGATSVDGFTTPRSDTSSKSSEWSHSHSRNVHTAPSKLSPGARSIGAYADAEDMYAGYGDDDFEDDEATAVRTTQGMYTDAPAGSVKSLHSSFQSEQDKAREPRHSDGAGYAHSDQWEETTLCKPGLRVSLDSAHSMKLMNQASNFDQALLSTLQEEKARESLRQLTIETVTDPQESARLRKLFQQERMAAYQRISELSARTA
eukprot:jgi/Chlat1/5972/Chrsp4S00485